MDRKKLIITVICLLLCISLFAGCSGSKGSSVSSAAVSGAPSDSQVPASATPKQETNSPKPSAKETVSGTSAGKLADGTYPVYVTGAENKNGKYLIKFKAIDQYDVIEEYLKKVYTAGQLIHDEKTGDYYTGDTWNMEQYYDNNYPLTEYKDGRVTQIGIQEVPKMLGISKDDFLSRISGFQNEDDNINLYTNVGSSAYEFAIRSDCAIKVSGALAAQAPNTDTLKPDALVKKVNQVLNDYGSEYIDRITLEIKNGEIGSFKEEFHP